MPISPVNCFTGSDIAPQLSQPAKRSQRFFRKNYSILMYHRGDDSRFFLKFCSSGFPYPVADQYSSVPLLPFDLGGVLFQPSQNLFGIFIRGKDWVENLFNFSCFDNEGQSLVQFHPLNVERRQVQSAL